MNKDRYLPNRLNPDINIDFPENFWGNLFNILYSNWGDPYWWPGKNAWEVAVGAILTQNTAWSNVEKAINLLNIKKINTAQKILETESSILEEAIHSSGYFRAKTKKLKLLAQWWLKWVDTGKIEELDSSKIRSSLLDTWGIGPETADSILCYSLGLPYFVVDAYTKRMLQRIKNSENVLSYEKIQNWVHEELPADTMLFNHLHALIVLLSKEHCQARNPKCDDCPLINLCEQGKINSGKKTNHGI